MVSGLNVAGVALGIGLFTQQLPPPAESTHPKNEKSGISGHFILKLLRTATIATI